MAAIDNARIERLREAAKRAEAHCYPRYSGFTVLAAVERVDGRVYGGANIENVNFSLTKHAEENAALAAIADGALALGDKWLAAVYTAGAPPCGGCRQFLWEWATPTTTCYIDYSSTGAGVEEHPLSSLLPHPFDPKLLPDRRT